MSSKDQILGKLRENRPSFPPRPVDGERRKVVNLADSSLEGMKARFIEEAEKLSCVVYPAEDAANATQIILDILGEQTQVIAWDDSALPFPLADALGKHNISIMPPDDTEILTGLTGVDAALAGTGSLVVQSRQGQGRGVSLLPDHHIALVKQSQILPDLETWVTQQRDNGLDAFKNSSNTVIISGPSKTADIAQELIKGAHGPRKVHIILIEND